MTEPVDVRSMIALSRKTLLRPRQVAYARRQRMFEALLAGRKQMPITPIRFLEVFDRVVKPIIVSATHCRVSMSAEQFPELERVAAGATDTDRAQLARYHLKRWNDAGVAPGPWLEAFTTRVKAPVKAHLTDGLVCQSPDERTQVFTFAAGSGDVEVNLASDAINTPLFWWWLFCGGFGVASVFFVDPGIVGSATFWQRTEDPYLIGGWRPWWVEFALREVSRSNRVALVFSSSLRLTTCAAAGVIERLYRTAAEAAVISEAQATEDARRRPYCDWDTD